MYRKKCILTIAGVGKGTGRGLFENSIKIINSYPRKKNIYIYAYTLKNFHFSLGLQTCL